MTLRRAVHEALLTGLHHWKPSRSRPPRKRFLVTTHDLKTKEAYRNLRSHELYDQLEAEQDRV